MPDNCIITIFGASGDLTKRKLLPALYDLYIQNLLPKNFAILGVGRTPLSDEDFRSAMNEGINKYGERKPVDAEVLEKFLPSLYYISIETSTREDYAGLKDKIAELDKAHNTEGNVLYYLASPPHLYEVIASHLGAYGLQKQNGSKEWKRLIVEKPFGLDLGSARKLNANLQKIFSEPQIYRIDHYLGKETVQNVLALRFSNGIFEPVWNRNYVDRVEITAAESIGVENRGGYYETSGALRDMIQNHLLQILGVVAMEPPVSYDATSVRNESIKVFKALRPIPADKVPDYAIRGQYTSSRIRGEVQKGYREEKGVSPDSRTETYAAVKLFIDNWRWGGVPFYIRAGKRLPTRVTEVVIHFKETPQRLFSRDNPDLFHNQLVIRIQPDEGIVLKYGMKLPGAGFKLKEVDMDFHYSQLSDVYLPSAYERLLLDCILGDATLYARADAVEACWEFAEPVLQDWKNNPESKIYGYPAGTWGPKEALALFEPSGKEWRYPCKNLTDDNLYCEL